jgi:hypothetical protein
MAGGSSSGRFISVSVIVKYSSEEHGKFQYFSTAGGLLMFCQVSVLDQVQMSLQNFPSSKLHSQ